VVGRKAGSLPGFHYSPSMRATPFAWDEKKLDAFLADPQHFVPGTKMAFSGLADAPSRRAVIAYLKRNSDSN
jgi:cytochrome c